MEIKAFIGTIYSTFCLFLQLAPIPGMLEGCRKGEIKSMTIGYFMTGITQANLWIGYGVCLKDFFVYFPNITCTSLFLTYLNMLMVNSHLLLILMPNLIIIMMKNLD